MGKTRTTFSLDEDVVRSMRIAAARQGLRDSEVVEAALRSYLGWDIIDRIRASFDMSEQEAEEFVQAEIYGPRAERRAARRAAGGA